MHCPSTWSRPIHITAEKHAIGSIQVDHRGDWSLTIHGIEWNLSQDEAMSLSDAIRKLATRNKTIIEE
jgi:hypothetical protein